MKKVICGGMTVAAVLFFLDQGGAFAMEKTKFYQLTYQTENVTGQITINGFVVTEMAGKTGNGSAALNPWLIGENELKAEVKKADSSKPAELAFGLSEMGQGEMVSTTDKGKLFSVELKIRTSGRTAKPQRRRNSNRPLISDDI